MGGKKQLVVVFFAFMLIMATTFTNAARINKNKIDEQKIIYKSSDISTYFLNPDFSSEDTLTKYIVLDTDEDAEEITLNSWENVTVRENGKLHLDITMQILSSKLVNLFKESLGLSEDLDEIDSDIPYETKRKILLKNEVGITEEEIIEPVRERFLEGVREEQKFLYGFHIIEFKSSRIYSKNLDKELIINIEAEALPRITYLSKSGSSKIFAMESSPREALNKFITYQSAISELMINHFPGRQIFVKNVDIIIKLPDSAKIVDIKGDKKSIDLGSSSVFLNLLAQENNQIKLSEKWIVSENQQLKSENEIDEIFKIKYEINDANDYWQISREVEEYDLSKLGDEPWSWSNDFNMIHLSGTEGNVNYLVDIDLYLALDGNLHLNLQEDEKEIYADFLFKAGLKVNATISGKWEKIWTFNLGQLSGKQYSWCGMVPLVITVVIDPAAKLYISVEGEVHVYINPEANFRLKAGGKLAFQWKWPPVHFKPIFESSTGGKFEKEFNLECQAIITPSLSVGISLLVYEVIGPRIEPEVYLEGKIGYSLFSGIYWMAELGFNLNVGVQFTRFIHFNWPSPVYHKPLASWKSNNAPTDTTPPLTTIYMGPQRNGYVGPCEYIWFDAVDPGIDASGIYETKFNIPQYNSNWYAINKSLVCNVITNLRNYDINYYSIDNAGNKENTKTKKCNVDLYAPLTGIGFKGEYKQIGDKTYEIVRSSTHVLLVGKEIEIFGNSGLRVWFKAKHESGYEMDWQITEYYDGNSDFGWNLSFEKKGRWDIIWVAEDGVWNVGSDTVTLYVKDNITPYSIYIDFPQKGDIIIFGRKLINYPAMSLALYIGGAVRCVACDNGSGVAKVSFECGVIKVVNETPSNGYFSAVISNIPEGVHTLYVRAYNEAGKEVANDSVEILKIGRA